MRPSGTAWAAGAALILMAAAWPAAGEGTRATARFVGPYAWRKDTSVCARSFLGRPAGRLSFDGAVEVSGGSGDSLDLEIAPALYEGPRFVTDRQDDCHSLSFPWTPLGRLGPGRHPFSAAFGGEAIRRRRLDGPWRARVLLFASRPASGGTVRREVIDSIAQPSPPFGWREFGEAIHVADLAEEPVDADGNGRVDSIHVIVRLEDPAPEALRLEVWSDELIEWYRRSEEGRRHEFSAPAFFGRGDSVAVAAFDGAVFRRLGRDGSYRFWSHPDFSDSVGLVTRLYRAAGFDGPVVELLSQPAAARAAPAAARWSDRVLTVQVPIRVRRAGRFSCTACIVTSDGTCRQALWLDSLGPGEATIPLRFDECALTRDGLTGPYHVTELRVWSEDNHSTVLGPLDFVTAPPDPRPSLERCRDPR